MHEVKIKITAEDIYSRLIPSEKERFQKVVITDVHKNGNEVIITGITIEKRDYDEKNYFKLLNEEFNLGMSHLRSSETPVRRL